ncbi:MAG: hypothetical protein LUH08_03100 [Ruminococcus sp.]|nr:hypothetical protein [Ruminococcus sp.]
MRKVVILGIAAAVLSLSACSVTEGDPLDGEELVEATREQYESYDSARVVITNEDTDEVEQEFVFMYDEKDSLTYLYTGGYEEESYIQYNNGFECFTEQNGEYTFTQYGDNDFEAYNRDSLHPQASGDYLPYERSAIETVEKTEQDGEVVYSYTYSPDSFDSDDGVVEFTAVYHFDENNELLYFEELSVVDTDGEESSHSYKVEITDINAVEEIDNPLKDREG